MTGGNKMIKLINNLIAEEDGQGLVEYSMIIVLVALAAILSIYMLGETLLTNYYELIANIFP